MKFFVSVRKEKKLSFWIDGSFENSGPELADMGEINWGGLPDLDLDPTRLNFCRDIILSIGEASPISIFQKVKEASPISISTWLDSIFVEILPPSRYLAHICKLVKDY